MTPPCADETALLDEYLRTRDITLRNALAEYYLPVAQAVAHRFSGRGVPYDDLFQVASLALLGALERFDPSQGAQLPTFAVRSLTGAVRNYFRDKAGALRLPRPGVELYARVRETARRLSLELGREPSISQIAQALEVRADDILDALEMNRPALSLDASAGQAEDGAEALSRLGQEDPAFAALETRDQLQSALALLTPQERRLLTLRALQGRSQREAAQELGVNQMRVSRMERGVYAKLRDILNDP
jgi:RNA polymerase sigma-B factor